MTPRKTISVWRKIGWRFEVIAYDILCLLARLVHFRQLSSFGGWLFRKIGPLTRQHKIVCQNLRIAFPEKSDPDIADIAIAQWENCGRTFAEFMLMHRLDVFGAESIITVKGLEHLRTHNPAVIISGHFANWEIMAAVLTQSGLPVRITYRQLNNPYMDARIRQQRRKYGINFLVRKSAYKSGRQLFGALQKGQSIAILNDQKFNEGLSMDFFSTPAMTAPGAVRLALKTQRPIIPMTVYRQGKCFIVDIYPPIPLEHKHSHSQNVRIGLEKIIAFTETYIRNHPTQWLWAHRRWPKHHYQDK